MATIQIREATRDDTPVIVRFNRMLAWETEQKRLDEKTVIAGVRAAIDDPSKATYLLAESEEAVVGQLMHTREWSDWRNGDIWWLQSVYVEQDYRGQGVFRALFEAIKQRARETPGVVGLRLYVENENAIAQSVYRNLGMSDGGYRVMELMH